MSQAATQTNNIVVPHSEMEIVIFLVQGTGLKKKKIPFRNVKKAPSTGQRGQYVPLSSSRFSLHRDGHWIDHDVH